MDHIFISYSRADQAFVDKLRSDLESYGAEVWLDVKDIRPGENWSDAIQRALDTCIVLVLVFSPDSVASEQVKHEWQYCQDVKKPIIPVIYRPAKAQFQLSRVQYIDFSRQQYLPALGQLCVELQARGVRLSGALPRPPKPASLTRRGGRIGCLAKSLLRAAVLAIVIGLTVVAVLTLRPQSEEKSPPTEANQPPPVEVPSENPNHPPEPVLDENPTVERYLPGDDPVEVVHYYFEALRGKDIDGIAALSCSGETAISEYGPLFGEWTFTGDIPDIRELENPTMRSVRVHFTFTLVMRSRNGEVREFNNEPYFFDIRRRDPDRLDSAWCSDMLVPPMFF